MSDHDNQCEAILMPVDHNRARMCRCEERSLRSRLAEADDALAIARFNCEAQAQANIALEKRLAEAERDMDQLIGERDHAQGMADKLADAIATLLGVEIGEHSNMNCPWEQALEAFEERAASTVTQDAAP
jgi:hypothetical protein